MIKAFRFCCSFRIPVLGGSRSTVGAHWKRCRREFRDGLEVKDAMALVSDWVHAGIAFSGMWRMVGVAVVRKSRMSWEENWRCAVGSGAKGSSCVGGFRVGFCMCGGGGLSI